MTVPPSPPSTEEGDHCPTYEAIVLARSPRRRTVVGTPSYFPEEVPSAPRSLPIPPGRSPPSVRDVQARIPSVRRRRGSSGGERSVARGIRGPRLSRSVQGPKPDGPNPKPLVVRRRRHRRRAGQDRYSSHEPFGRSPPPVSQGRRRVSAQESVQPATATSASAAAVRLECVHPRLAFRPGEDCLRIPKAEYPVAPPCRDANSKSSGFFRTIARRRNPIPRPKLARMVRTGRPPRRKRGLGQQRREAFAVVVADRAPSHSLLTSLSTPTCPNFEKSKVGHPKPTLRDLSPRWFDSASLSSCPFHPPTSEQVFPYASAASVTKRLAHYDTLSCEQPEPKSLGCQIHTVVL